jgi:hypothetical protein
VARFNTNGSLDTTFGTAGVAALQLNGALLALQSDGKIIVAGQGLETREASWLVSTATASLIPRSVAAGWRRCRLLAPTPSRCKPTARSWSHLAQVPWPDTTTTVAATRPSGFSARQPRSPRPRRAPSRATAKSWSREWVRFNPDESIDTTLRNARWRHHGLFKDNRYKRLRGYAPAEWGHCRGRASRK